MNKHGSSVVHKRVIIRRGQELPKTGGTSVPAVRKGLELPVNAVIVISLAVLVLVVVSMFFSSSTGTSTRAISDNDAWARGCALAKAKACQAADFSSPGLAISSYDPDGDGDNDNLYTACYRVFQDVANPSSSAPADTDIGKCRTRCCGE